MVPIPVEARYFSLLKNVWTDSRTQLATYPMGTGFISLDKVVEDMVKISPSAQLRIRGAIYPVHLYAIMAWRGTSLPVPLYYTDCPQSFTQRN